MDIKPLPEWPDVLSFSIPLGRSLPSGSRAYVGADTVVNGKPYSILLIQNEAFVDAEAAKTEAVKSLAEMLVKEGVVPR